jgi:hypothetical protein
MKIFLRPMLVVGLLAIVATANAATSPAARSNINLMVHGGAESLQEAARNIYNGDGAEQEASDVLAEELLENIDKPGNSYVQALSWACKGLANTGSKRYYTAVKQAAESGNKKIRKYCDKAADDLGSADGPQYTKGMVSLSKLQEKGPAAADSPAAERPAVSKHAASGHYQPISAATVGMSLQEAEDLIGPPTSTTEHITGKAFIPFNFKGGDTYRIIYLYKGQGRVIFSSTSRYARTLRVHEVQENPDEGGYP